MPCMPPVHPVPGHAGGTNTEAGDQLQFHAVPFFPFVVDESLARRVARNDGGGDNLCWWCLYELPSKFQSNNEAKTK